LKHLVTLEDDDEEVEDNDENMVDGDSDEDQNQQDYHGEIYG